MSEPAIPNRPFYVTGGTLKPGEPSYVERRADDELFESLLAGEFCYILTARQMGKSSLMARTAARLEQAGVRSSIVDLSQMGSERGTQASTQWYFGIANKIHQQLKITDPLRPWWQERTDLPPVQRLTDFFRELVLTHCPGRAVIFVDEIDSTIGLPFADDFFAALRACFNARATEPAFERLTFALLGAATPAQLIQDPARTPFNIGKRIDLTDFSPEEARTLAPGLHTDPGEAEGRLERILYWTGGHPYLTQALCRAVRERAGDDGTAEKAVDPQVEELFLASRAQREEMNLNLTRARLERSGPEKRRLLQLYRRVRQGKPVPDQPTSPLFAQLKLAGVVKATNEGRLAVRNRIYESVFTPEWASTAMPSDRGWQLAAATLAVALMGVLVWYAVFQPRPYERSFQTAIKDDGYNTALQAYKALHANPFSRSRATELLEQFWESRTLKYAKIGKRDESLLCALQRINLSDDRKFRGMAQNLVGKDYEWLRLTLWQSDEIWALGFSPDDRNLAIGSSHGSTTLCGTIKGDIIGGFEQFLEQIKGGFINAAVFSPDGRTLGTGSSDGGANLWNLITWKSLISLSQREAITALAFSPNNQIVATGTSDGTAQLWNTANGRALGKPLLNNSPINSLAFSPDGRTVLTAYSDGTARLWGFNSENLSPPLQHHESILSASFSPDGQSIIILTGFTRVKKDRNENGVGWSEAASNESFTVWHWDTHSRKLLSRTSRHQPYVIAAAPSLDGQTVATGSRGSSRLWSLSLEQPLSPILKQNGSIISIALSRDGKIIATGSTAKSVRLWGVHSEIAPPPSLQDDIDIASVKSSPNGQTLALLSARGIARLWDKLSRKPLAPPLQNNGPVLSLIFSPDGRTLATSSFDGTVRLWDARTGKLLIPPLQHQESVLALAFSPDSKVLLTGTRDNTAILWDAQSGRPLRSLKQQSVFTAAFSPDGETIVTGAMDGTVQLWDTRSGRRKMLVSPSQQEDLVAALAFSPDGKTILIGSRNKSLRLWDARSGEPLISPLPLQNYAQSLAFSPDGKAFFVATGDWFNTYTWDGKNATPLSTQLLHGSWTGGFHFPSNCTDCLEVALGDTGNSLRIETLRLDEPTDPPIKGDPKELLKIWQARLGLKFDEQMRPVPAVDFPRGSSGDARQKEPPPRAQQR